MNPFINIPHYPAFDQMTPENAQAAFAQLLPEAHAAIDALEKNFTPSWQGLMTPLYDACHPLLNAWGLFNHLLSVVNSDAWREAQEAIQPDVVAFSLRVGQSKTFYGGFRALRDADAATPCLTDTRRRILTKAIQEAEHAGVGLPEEQQARFNTIQTELAQHASAFRNNLLDATKAFSLTLETREEIGGLPTTLLSITAQRSEALGVEDAGGATVSPPSREGGPWRITLDAPVYIPFMMHSTNRPAREALYRAFVTRASSGSLDNTPLLERILALKREMATLLGYPTYADLNLSNKTAKTVAAVDGLIAQLADAAIDIGRHEMTALTAFAHANGLGGSPLLPWDIAFWAERQREKSYDYNEEELSKYLPYPTVLEGLFNLTQRLFGIRIVECPDVPSDIEGAREQSNAVEGNRDLRTSPPPVWHPDVKFFHVLDADGTPLAGIYSDPYSRPQTKSGGAWMNAFTTRRRNPDGRIQLPLAFMSCNQTPPGRARLSETAVPPLMRFDEVRTLFHEFGHVLQHILTTVDDPEASGVNGIEWDAIEIASQFMENWCYDRATLKGMSRNIETGAPIPDDLFDRIIAAKNFRSATTLLRQIFFAATDMDLYARPDGGAPNDVKNRNAAKYSPVPMLDEDRFLCSFSHIFGGGYAAGYYSYKWSEVMSADAFAAFEEVGLDNEEAVRTMGRRFRDTFLALGGSVDPMAIFQRFRHRAPSIQSLLRHAGLLDSTHAGQEVRCD
ncbi:MAG: M3 family metallopeptidase [Kiritimatiellaeota bacterium]|nr:M3 family metallopeptidase [Kiritimatiellota bacterium]